MSDDISLIPQERIENLNETLSNVQPKLSSVNAGAGINITEEEGIVKISGTSSAPAWGQVTGTLSNQTDLQNALDDKQDELVSGTNIKTINNVSILGSGNIDIQGGGSYTAGTGIDITNDVISVEGVKDQRNTSTAIKIWTGTKAQYDALLPTSTTYYAWNGTVTIYTTSSTPSIGDNVYTYYNGVMVKQSDEFSITNIGSSWIALMNNIDSPFNRNSSGDVTITSSGSIDANTLYNITDDTDVSLTILEALYPVGSVYITTANTCPLSTLIAGSTWVQETSRVLVEKKEPTDSDPTWYNLYSDGWCIQGGKNIRGDTITLPKPFKDTNYSIATNCESSAQSQISSTAQEVTASSFSIWAYAGGSGFVGAVISWHACGYTSIITSHKQFRRTA